MKFKLLKKKPKVLLAMSGGVDSSVAALILKKQGYEIVGAFMKNWSDTKNEIGECKWREERAMALKIANMLDIPLITLDFEKQYKKQVVEKMFQDYKKGITPNPDVDCNQKIKFPLLIKEAKKIGAKYVVTGHYARIKKTRKGYVMLRAKDETKDQSYFLYRLSQTDLKNSYFPIGNYTKKQIRKIAEKNHLPNYNKKSTVGICFIGKINLKDFLQQKIRPKKGKMLSPEGKVLGEHDGVYYYTIGQRIGPRFGIEVERGKGQALKRWYVAKKDIKTNTLVVAPEGHPLLYKKEIILKEPHWILNTPKNNQKVLARIRQVGELLPAKIEYRNKEKSFKVTLNKAITGVSEGQAIVLYSGKIVLGGGVISFN